MLPGEPYSAVDPELVDDRIACRKLLRRLNIELEYDDVKRRNAVLQQLLNKNSAQDGSIWIEPPFNCDFG